MNLAPLKKINLNLLYNMILFKTLMTNCIEINNYKNMKSIIHDSIYYVHSDLPIMIILIIP